MEQGLDFDGSAEAREKPLAHSKAVAANFNEMITRHNIDVMIAPSDYMLSTCAAASSESSQVMSLRWTYRRSQVFRD